MICRMPTLYFLTEKCFSVFLDNTTVGTSIACLTEPAAVLAEPPPVWHRWRFSVFRSTHQSLSSYSSFHTTPVSACQSLLRSERYLYTVGCRNYRIYQQKQGGKRDNHERDTLAFFAQSRSRGFDTWYIYAFGKPLFFYVTKVTPLPASPHAFTLCHITTTAWPLVPCQ